MKIPAEVDGGADQARRYSGARAHPAGNKDEVATGEHCHLVQLPDWSPGAAILGAS